MKCSSMFTILGFSALALARTLPVEVNDATAAIPGPNGPFGLGQPNQPFEILETGETTVIIIEEPADVIVLHPKSGHPKSSASKSKPSQSSASKTGLPQSSFTKPGLPQSSFTKPGLPQSSAPQITGNTSAADHYDHFCLLGGEWDSAVGSVPHHCKTATIWGSNAAPTANPAPHTESASKLQPPIISTQTTTTYAISHPTISAESESGSLNFDPHRPDPTFSRNFTTFLSPGLTTVAHEPPVHGDSSLTSLIPVLTSPRLPVISGPITQELATTSAYTPPAQVLPPPPNPVESGTDSSSNGYSGSGGVSTSEFSSFHLEPHIPTTFDTSTTSRPAGLVTATA